MAFSQDTTNPLRTSKTGMRLPWRRCLAFVPWVEAVTMGAYSSMEHLIPSPSPHLPPHTGFQLKNSKNVWH